MTPIRSLHVRPGLSMHVKIPEIHTSGWGAPQAALALHKAGAADVAHAHKHALGDALHGGGGVRCSGARGCQLQAEAGAELLQVVLRALLAPQAVCRIVSG